MWISEKNLNQIFIYSENILNVDYDFSRMIINNSNNKLLIICSYGRFCMILYIRGFVIVGSSNSLWPHLLKQFRSIKTSFLNCLWYLKAILIARTTIYKTLWLPVNNNINEWRNFTIKIYLRIIAIYMNYRRRYTFC